MNVRSRVGAAGVAFALALATEAGDRVERAAEPEPTLLLGPEFPIEVVVHEHVGRFHWLDSLAGLRFPGSSAGKTVDAHRDSYIRLFGRPGAIDRARIEEFGGVRARYAEEQLRRFEADEPFDFGAILTTVFEAPTEEAALDDLSDRLSKADVRLVAGAMAHYRDTYREFWRDGTFLEAFLEDARTSPRREALASTLVRMARFYGVALPTEPRPRLLLVPVPSGYGTHAMALGRNLLVELRARDRLKETASVIAHENAHFLFMQIPEARRIELEEHLARHGEAGREAWQRLQEALPTALGQGIVDRGMRPLAWSKKSRWYHIDEIDRYAKALFPIVREKLESDGKFDETFLDRAWELYPFKPAPDRDSDAARPETAGDR